MHSKVYICCYESGDGHGDYIIHPFIKEKLEDKYQYQPSEGAGTIGGLAKLLQKYSRMSKSLTVINDVKIEELPNICTPQEDHFHIFDSQITWYRKLDRNEFNELKEMMKKSLIEAKATLA